MILYQIKRNGKYLQGVRINEKRYSKTATAPTMGNCHAHSEYLTDWGLEPKCFEFLTASNYIKIIMEEYRWQEKKPSDLKIIPIIK